MLRDCLCLFAGPLLASQLTTRLLSRLRFSLLDTRGSRVQPALCLKYFAPLEM